MIPILQYILQVHERTQKIDFIKCTPHMDLVEDFVYDMKSKNIEFHSDEEVLDYLDNAISDSLVRQAFCDFKRNYKAWLRRRK